MTDEANFARGASGVLPILEELRSDGYTVDMVALEGGSIRCGSCGEASPAQDVGADGLRRTEGASDPADMTAVVALTCPRCGERGAMVVTYGPEAAIADADVLAALPTPGEVNTVERRS